MNVIWVISDSLRRDHVGAYGNKEIITPNQDIDSIQMKSYKRCKIEPITPGKNNGFILDTTITPASEHDSKYLPYLAIASCHTEEPIERIYADKGYIAQWNTGLKWN